MGRFQRAFVGGFPEYRAPAALLYGFRQDFILRWISYSPSQINPDIESEKVERRFRIRQEYRDYRKRRLASLPIQREVTLALLPASQTVPANQNCDSAAAIKRSCEPIHPGQARRQIPAVEKNAQTPLVQGTRYLLDFGAVLPMIAEEYVVS